MPDRPDRPISPLVRTWRTAFARVEDQRLAAALAVAHRELVPMLHAFGDPGRRDAITTAVTDLLARAEAARARGKVDEGWHCLEAGRRLAVFGVGEPEAVALATALRSEAQAKLHGWRRGAILAQLRGTGDAVATDRFRLHVAMRLRDEHHQNQYYRTRLVARQFKTIALYLGIALAGMLVADRLGAPFPSSGATDARHLLPWMALFGLLGATFSVAFPLTRGTADGRRIPEHVGGQAITLIRPLLGAAAGPVAYAFVRSGLFSAAAASENTLLLVAFASGFSERLILRAVGSVAGDAPDVAPRPARVAMPRDGAADGVPAATTLGTGATLLAETAELAVPVTAALGAQIVPGGPRDGAPSATDRRP